MARIDQVLAGQKTWGQYALDVAGHAGLGGAYSLGPILLGLLVLDAGPWRLLAAGELFALIGGVLREVLQWRSSGRLHLVDRLLDVAQHLVGPPIVLGLVYLIKALAS